MAPRSLVDSSPLGAILHRYPTPSKAEKVKPHWLRGCRNVVWCGSHQATQRRSTMTTKVSLSVKYGMPRSVIKRSDILAATALLNFAADNSFVIDPTALQSNNDQFPVLGMAVDNSLNPNPLNIVTQTPFSESFSIPAYSCARLPFESGQPALLTLKSASTFSGTVQVTLFNYVPAPVVWYPQGISINTASAIATYAKQSNPLGYVQQVGIPASASLASFGTGIPAGANSVLIGVETQNIRWRDDGVAPTAGIGMRIFANGFITFNQNLANIRFIEENASTTLDISYYKN